MESASTSMNEIKELMQQYDRAQRASQSVASIRKRLVLLLKQAGMTKTKFNFGDRNISYHTYGSYEELTQRLIRSVVKEKYPQIDSEQFIADLYAARKRRTVETLKATPKKQT